MISPSTKVLPGTGHVRNANVFETNRMRSKRPTLGNTGRSSYQQLRSYVAGELHNITESTLGMGRAKAARDLVATKPDMAAPENKDALLKAIGYD